MTKTHRPGGCLQFCFRRAGFHQQRTQCRTERQGTESRNGHGHGHSQTELPVIGTAETAHESRWDEHTHEDNGGGDNGCRNVVHRLVGGLLGSCRRVFQFLLHRLHHDDGIIDHSTDDQHQCEESDEVEREANHIHEGKGAHERDNNAHRRNDGGTPVLQEQQHHENDEQQGLKQRLIDRVHRGVEEVVGVQEHSELQSCRQVWLQLFHEPVYLIVYSLRISTGGRGNDGNSAIVGVHPTVAGISYGAQFHACHIAEMQVIKGISP